MDRPQGEKKKPGLRDRRPTFRPRACRSTPDASSGLEVGDKVKARFRIPPGAMPEGFESAVRMDASIVRRATNLAESGEEHMLALEFEKPLTEYFQRKRWGYSVYSASALMFVAVLFIILMRAESIIYFKYNMVLYLYSLIATLFLLTRYLFGALYRDVPIHPDYTPGVSIIIPASMKRIGLNVRFSAVLIRIIR